MTGSPSIPELDRRGLRQFGLTTGAAVVFIFGGMIPWLFDFPWPAWPWAIAGVFWVLALIEPLWLRPIYRAWMRFGQLAGRVMTPLVLGIVFFLMITPFGWLRRRLGNDPLRRTLDPQQESYRVKSVESPREKLERPF